MSGDLFLDSVKLRFQQFTTCPNKFLSHSNLCQKSVKTSMDGEDVAYFKNFQMAIENLRIILWNSGGIQNIFTNEINFDKNALGQIISFVFCRKKSIQDLISSTRKKRQTLQKWDPFR